jgi:hypothetical protein
VEYTKKESMNTGLRCYHCTPREMTNKAKNILGQKTKNKFLEMACLIWAEFISHWQQLPQPEWIIISDTLNDNI